MRTDILRVFLEEHAPKSCLKHIKDGHKDRMLCNTRNNLDFNLIRGYYTPYLGMVCQEKSSRDKDSYWDDQKNTSRELWAEYFSYQMAGDKEALQNLREYFPEAADLLEQYANGLATR